MNAFQFDATLSTAATIPASWYTDPARWPLEQAHIFRRTWQYACALERLRFPGNCVAVDVVGVPVLLTRDLGSELSAFYNVCRHRAGIVAKGTGNRKTLQCLYHGWLYNLNGSLRNAPEFEGVDNFDPCAFDGVHHFHGLLAEFLSIARERHERLLLRLAKYLTHIGHFLTANEIYFYYTD